MKSGRDSGSLPVRVAVVGCGAVTRLFHASALVPLARDGCCQVVALVDPSPDSLRAVGSRFPGAKLLESVDALPEGPGLAIVATPPRMHRPHARACFSKGWDVLCEKPLAAEVDDAEALVSDAHAAGRILIAGHYKRFFPVFRQIRELIHGGQLGQLRSIRIREGGKFGWPAATASFFDPSQTPGGVLLDIGVHVLDILHWWLGTPESFDYEDDAMGGLEANCRLRGQFRGGATLDLFLSRDWATEDAWTLRFERGCAVYRVNQANRLRLTVEGLSRAMEATLQEGIQEADTNALSFSAQTAEALRCVASRAAPSVPGPEGLHALRWIRECYERRRLMTPPWFTPGEAARAESLAAGKGGMPR